MKQSNSPLHHGYGCCPFFCGSVVECVSFGIYGSRFLCPLSYDLCLTLWRKSLCPFNHLDKEEIPDLEVIKLSSCSTQLSIKFNMLIIVKMPTIQWWYLNIYKYDSYTVQHLRDLKLEKKKIFFSILVL